MRVGHINFTAKQGSDHLLSGIDTWHAKSNGSCGISDNHALRHHCTKQPNQPAHSDSASSLDLSPTSLHHKNMKHTLVNLSAGDKKMQVRLVARGCETVLGDAASEAELFLTDDFLTRQVCTL